MKQKKKHSSHCLPQTSLDCSSYRIRIRKYHQRIGMDRTRAKWNRKRNEMQSNNRLACVFFFFFFFCCCSSRRTNAKSRAEVDTEQRVKKETTNCVENQVHKYQFHSCWRGKQAFVPLSLARIHFAIIFCFNGILSFGRAVFFSFHRIIHSFIRSFVLYRTLPLEWIGKQKETKNRFSSQEKKKNKIHS